MFPHMTIPLKATGGHDKNVIFSKWVTGPDGLESGKNMGKKSSDTVPLGVVYLRYTNRNHLLDNIAIYFLEGKNVGMLLKFMRKIKP